MTLRRKEKCFDVRAKPIDERLKRFRSRLACEALLLCENPLRVYQIVCLADALQDKIETMDRCAVRREELRDRFEASR
ncbi:MAG: hypothetical protein QOF24_3101 [Verrucomicrobiota bacterium]